MCRLLVDTTQLLDFGGRSIHTDFHTVLAFYHRTQFAKFDDIQRNIVWSNIETVNYLELLVCSVSKKYWALLYFPWKFKLSHEPICMKFGNHGVERIQVQRFWRDAVIMSGQCLECHGCSVSAAADMHSVGMGEREHSPELDSVLLLFR